MKFRKSNLLSALCAMTLLSGVAMAEDGVETDDSAYCREEAQAAGMVSEEEIRDYVGMCLDELSTDAAATESEQSLSDESFGSLE